METAMERPDALLERALAVDGTGQAMVIVGLRIGQQIQEIFKENCSDNSITVLAPGESAALSLIRGLEMTTPLSRAGGQIAWRMGPQHRVIAVCGSQQAEFEIRSSLLRMIDEGGKNRNEENIALQVWELAPDEIYLLTVEE
jgi:hypothetical protein